MSPKLAAVDASVIILLTAPPRPDDPTERALRRERASTSMQELRDDGFRFFVPAPAIVELSVHESGERLAERVLARLGGFEVAPLDLLAARAAALALREVLKARPLGESRHLIKFDALIAAVAHEKRAKIIATADPRHFERHLRALSSTVEVVDVASPKQEPGQLRLIDRQPKK